MKITIVARDKDLMGSILPRWYGFAYRRFEYAETVLYIIPLNLIVRYAYKIYSLIYRWIKHDGWSDKQDDAYWRGYNDGNTTREHHFETLAYILKGKK